MARWRYGGWGSGYVSASSRRQQAERKLAALRKQGREVSPVEVEGRKIAKTFWGKAWCDNLERYSDFSNRLPRGRTYVRNGSVIHLHVAEGEVTALVSGSDIYEVTLNIATLSKRRWKALQKECGGEVSSVLELLQGRLSTAVMGVVTRAGEGLFPEPREIRLDCSCPDWATMCKHVAAVLYGVGARLDHEPKLLFELRGVDPADMVEQAVADVQKRPSSGRYKRLEGADLSKLFGVDIEQSASKRAKKRRKRKR